MKNTILVVEGKNDVAHLAHHFPQYHIISVNGSAIKNDVIELLKKTEPTTNIVLLLDPDHAGERIRNILSNHLKHPHHIFFDREVAISSNGKKIGVEHVDIKIIKEKIEKIKLINTVQSSDITQTFLYEKQLVGHKNASHLRDIVSKKLQIGNVNGKTLLKRLHLFGYQKKDLEEVLNEASA